MSPTIFSSIINSYLPEPHSALLNGIIFGIPLKSSKVFYHQIQIVGLLHLVVLSGMNITILAHIIDLLVSKFVKKIRLIITIGCIVGFTLFVGPQPPIVRAAIMGSLTYIAILYGRKSTALVSLLISVLIIALVKPEWIKTISFQLSTGATCGIILFRKNTQVQAGSKLREILSSIKNDLHTTFAASLFTVPIIFIYFRQISFIAPLANIMVSFLMAPLMVFGFATSVLGKISWVLGLPTAYICYGLLSYMVFIIDVLSKIPLAFFEIK
jgi:competence protein ComEC